MLLNAIPNLIVRESLIIAQAGMPSSLTISTNIAGRGTDILLGGDPNIMAMDQLKYWLCCNFLKRDEFETFVLESTHNNQLESSNPQTTPWLYVLDNQHTLHSTS